MSKKIKVKMSKKEYEEYSKFKETRDRFKKFFNESDSTSKSKARLGTIRDHANDRISSYENTHEFVKNKLNSARLFYERNGEGLISQACSCNLMLKIGFSVIDQLDQKYQINLYTDGMHGVSIGVISGSCFNIDGFLVPKGCNSDVSCWHSIRNVIDELRGSNLLSFSARDGKYTNSDNTNSEVKLPSISLVDLILAMIADACKILLQNTLQNTNDGEMPWVRYDSNQDKNVCYHSSSYIYKIEVTFLDPNENDEIDFDAYFDKCKECEYNEFDSDDECECEHTCNCTGNCAADEIDEDEENLLEKVDTSDSNANADGDAPNPEEALINNED